MRVPGRRSSSRRALAKSSRRIRRPSREATKSGDNFGEGLAGSESRSRARGGDIAGGNVVLVAGQAVDDRCQRRLVNWRRRYDDAEPLRAKVETYELANDAALWRVLEDQAGDRFHTLWQEHRAQITVQPRERRARYEELCIVARHEEPGILDLPETIALEIAPDAPLAADHLYVDDAGLFRLPLTGWEQAVLAAERDQPGFVTWIRNLDRKPWSLGIPYEFGRQRRPLFPDFIIVRRAGEHYVADLLEPHRGEDSVAKAKGLAQFADLHGNNFGRIEMIRVEGSELRRLDFNDHRIREAVFPIQAHDELTRLFDTV